MDFSQFQHQPSNKANIHSTNQSDPKQKILKQKKIETAKNDTSKMRKNPLNVEYQSSAIETLTKILKWRQSHEAPVDVVGCERLADEKESIMVQKYQTLVALMLSVQTKDQTTFKCMNRLKQYGLNPTSIAQINEAKLIQMIYECNFNKRKAKNIIEVSRMILQSNKIAATKQELLKYPGVGIKISMIYLRVAENKDEGIGVDTHVHRISNRLGWAKSTNPNETEEQLQQLFPVKYWNEINLGLVGFGQILCSAKNPMCNKCPVWRECPSSMVKSDIQQMNDF